MKSKSVMNSVRTALVLGTISACGLAIAGGPAVEVIYTKIPTHPSSVIPGALDSAGDPATTNFRSIDNLYLSPDGSRWVFSGRTQMGSDNETILMIGSETEGTMFLQEGRPVPDGAAGEIIDFFGSGVGRFNELNHFAFSLRARGGVASVFQKVLVYTGGLTPSDADFNLVAQMGDLYSGLIDVPANPTGDETIGNSIGSIHILNNGVLGSQDSTIGNIHTSLRPAIFYGAPVEGAGITFNSFHQTGVTSFTQGKDSFLVKTLSANSFYTTPDGTRWLTRGQIQTGGTTDDDVLVVDGAVVLRESQPIPNTSVNVGTIVEAELLPNGDWYARGAIHASSGGGVYAVRNGELLAKTGDAIGSPAGPSENWASTFLTLTGNTNGDWVLVGRTNNANLGIDDVVVVNGEVVLREGDNITLEGYEGTICIGRATNTLSAFEANDASLSSDGLLYLFVTINDCQGNDLNSSPSFGTPQAFVRINLGGDPLPCGADISPPGEPDGVVNANDLLAVINSWGPCPKECPPSCFADITGDCAVNANDLLAVINSWGACPK